MKVQRKINATTILEVEGASVQEVFENLAALEDCFGVATVCGLCGGRALRHVLRQNEGFKFFELHCKNPTCKARLAFGQPKHGKGLFVQRKDKDGNWKPNGGWEKWQPENGGEHPQQEAPPGPVAEAPQRTPAASPSSALSAKQAAAKEFLAGHRKEPLKP